VTIPNLALQAVRALGIDAPAGFNGTFSTFHLLAPNDRIRVTNYSTAYVRANPEQFTSSEYTVAVRFAPVSEMVSDSFDYRDFFRETGSNAVELIGAPLVNIGQTASKLALVAPLVLIVLAGFYASRQGWLKR